LFLKTGRRDDVPLFFRESVCRFFLFL